MAWIAPGPLDRRRLGVLGQRPSPLSAALSGSHLLRARVLVDSEDRPEGLGLDLESTTGSGGRFCLRFWPRPGALWVTDARGNVRAQEGRMEGPSLEARLPRPESSADPGVDDHDRRCQERWERYLADEVRHRLERTLRQKGRALRRKRDHLQGDLSDPTEIAAWRAEADLLAAHLHEIRRGQTRLECLDFEGHPRVLDLDAELLPHQNLDRRYRRVHRAERRQERVQEQLALLGPQCLEQEEREARLRTLPDPASDLDAWLDLAEEWKIDLRPAPDPRSTAARPPRRPYWTYLLDSEWEVRVGRSARDNDAMLRAHRNGQDRWLHAQGVAGSHVILRCGQRDVPRSVLEAAARLAAHFSQARRSETVAVLHTHRRYVRKPRKSAPGLVTVDRAQTIFVTPGLPEGCRKVDS